MSNVYRLAHVPDITYDVVDLPPDVRDADWLHRILQGGAEAVTVPDDWPILAAPDQSMSKLVRFSHDPGMALSCEFDPADNDEIVLALNNALQIDLHRRTGPPCTIQFFISGIRHSFGSPRFLCQVTGRLAYRRGCHLRLRRGPAHGT